MKKSEESMISPDQIIGIIINRRWLIIVPFMLATIVGIYLAITLPRIYEAKTLILVEQQRVPADYVRSVVSTDINERINTMRQQILSRTNLEKVINQFNLFSEPGQQNMFLEEKVERLRKRIKVEVISDENRNKRTDAEAFMIAYQGTDPQTVMRIANNLASFFIDENLKVREAQAIGTSNFLEDELETMRQRLEKVEAKLKSYRERYMGELPEQLQTNLSILNRLQDRLSDRQQALRDEKSVLVALENQLKIAEQQLAAEQDKGDLINGQRQAPETELDRLKRQLADLKNRYTDKHPDVVRTESLIKNLEQEEASQDGDQPSPVAKVSPSASKIAGIIAEYKRQQNEAQLEIGVIEAEIKDLMSKITFYQKRIENTPKREQELLSLKRDYENIQTSYNSLLSRKLEAEISVNMEKKQQGEQFRILDTARVPEKPIKPDMRKLFLMVLAGGLGLGGGIVFLLEYFNTSFRKPEEVEGYLELPVLATIPRLLREKDRRRKKLNWALSVASICASLVLFAGFAVLMFNGVEQTVELVKRFVG